MATIKLPLTKNEKAVLYSRYLFAPVRVIAAVWKPKRQTMNEKGETILTPEIIADCWDGTFEFERFKLQLKPYRDLVLATQQHVSNIFTYSADYFRHMGYDVDEMIEQGFAEEIIE